MGDVMREAEPGTFKAEWDAYIEGSRFVEMTPSERACIRIGFAAGWRRAKGIPVEAADTVLKH